MNGLTAEISFFIIEQQLFLYVIFLFCSSSFSPTYNGSVGVAYLYLIYISIKFSSDLKQIKTQDMKQLEVFFSLFNIFLCPSEIIDPRIIIFIFQDSKSSFIFSKSSILCDNGLFYTISQANDKSISV